jgi:hypothetical protein
VLESHFDSFTILTALYQGIVQSDCAEGQTKQKKDPMQLHHPSIRASKRPSMSSTTSATRTNTARQLGLDYGLYSMDYTPSEVLIHITHLVKSGPAGK